MSEHATRPESANGATRPTGRADWREILDRPPPLAFVWVPTEGERRPYMSLGSQQRIMDFVFGIGGWTSEYRELTIASNEVFPDTNGHGYRRSVTAHCVARVTATPGDGTVIIHEAVGADSAVRRLGGDAGSQAVEVAIKAAQTSAGKRALARFGRILGRDLRGLTIERVAADDRAFAAPRCERWGASLTRRLADLEPEARETRVAALAELLAGVREQLADPTFGTWAEQWERHIATALAAARTAPAAPAATDPHAAGAPETA